MRRVGRVLRARERTALPAESLLLVVEDTLDLVLLLGLVAARVAVVVRHGTRLVGDEGFGVGEGERAVAWSRLVIVHARAWTST